jgi:hypothetical protein
MKAKTKEALLEAWAYCDEEDKSTEFMLQYMQDAAGVDLDCVLKFMERTTDKERMAYAQQKAAEEDVEESGGEECPICGIDYFLIFDACADCGYNPYSDG